MKSYPSILLFGTLALALLGGCVSDPFHSAAPEAVVLRESQVTTDILIRGLKGRLTALQDGRRIDLGENLIVSSLVDVNDVTASSPFGRIFSEQMASAFAQRGINVTELKMGDVVRVGNSSGSRTPNGKWDDGEFVLTRNARDLADQRGASAIICGTYAAGGEQVLVTVRALDAKSGRILAGRSFTVPYSTELFRGNRLIR